MDFTPALKPLIDKFGHYEVWHTAVETLGWPPTWATTNDLLKVWDVLESKFQS